MWKYEKTPSDKIILIFPSSTSITNDMRLEWSKYAEVKTKDEDYQPTIIYAELFKNNHKVGLIDYTATWNTTFSYPTELKAKLQINPIKFDIELSFADKIMTLNTSVKKNMRTLDDLTAEVTFKDDTMDKVTKLNGVFKTYDLNSTANTGVLMKIIFDADIAAINAKDDPSCADINSNMNIKLYASSNRLFATVECVDSADCGANIVFTDGTTKSVCDYSDKLNRVLENIIREQGLDKK